METRIRYILEREQLSPAEFADKIKVQRPSVSHVLSGRNKPSFQFIEKILSSFPNINARWLIQGQGDMYQEGTEPVSTTSLFEDKNENTESVMEPMAPPAIEFSPKEEPEQLERKQPPVIESGSRKIERILVFYEDKTFEEYFPGK
ncbi:XRE family transcriptional regulator [Prolixibacteraceae bacterium JC049]|nr:XRE family transcriptional regulator [Prolixibacteraceae bacterium JC049]